MTSLVMLQLGEGDNIVQRLLGRLHRQCGEHRAFAVVDVMELIADLCGHFDPCPLLEGLVAVEQRAWVKVTAKVGYKFHNIYRGKGPVLTALSVEPAEKPLNDVVTFS